MKKLKIKSRISKLSQAVSAMLITGCMLSNVAYAAEGNDEVTTEEAESKGLEQVMVITRKRVQSLQDVSVSVTAIGGEELDDLGIDNFDQLEIPGVHIGQGGDTDTLFIRGVGSLPLGRGFEQSVPIYIDGAYFGRARQQRLAFLDVEGIEVLKGPQPTYLGKNAIGGAVSITSRRPTEFFEGSVEYSREFNFNESTFIGSVSGPVSDSVRMRGVVKNRTADGWLKNEAVGGRYDPNQDDIIARVGVEWDVTDKIEVFAKLEYAKIEQSGSRPRQRYGCDNSLIAAGLWDTALEDCVINESFAVTYNPNDFPRDLLSDRAAAIPADQTTDMELEHKGSQVIVNWDINGYTLTSNTAYYSFDLFNFDVISSGTGSIVAGELPEEFSQFSEELRLTSPLGGNIEWMAGLYFDSNDLMTASSASIVNTLGVAIDRELTQEADSWAVFADVAIKISDPLTLRLGGRYSEVNKTASYFNDIFLILPDLSLLNLDFAGVGLDYSNEKRTDTDFQPAVTFEWKSDDNHMFYASWKEGFKGGGFDNNADNLDNIQFEPETVTAFEIGNRSTFLDNAIRLNASIFLAEYKDLQVNIFNPNTIAFATQNAGKAITSGAEVSFAWMVTDNFKVSTNTVFLDSYFDDFPGARCFGNPVQTAEQGCDAATGLQNLGEHIGPAGNKLEGQELAFAPDWSNTLSLDYYMSVGSSLDFSAKLDIFTTDDFYAATATRDPDFIQEGYTKIDLFFDLNSQDGTWGVSLFARNITNEITSHFKEDTVGELSTSNSAFIDMPRQIGLKVKYNF